MGLRNYLEKILGMNEIEASKEVENILRNKGFGYDNYVLSENLPLYIRSNWLPIAERILSNAGKLKLALKEKPILPRFLLKDFSLLENLEIYKIDKNPNRTHTLIYNTYFLFSNNPDKVFLTSNYPKKERAEFESFFGMLEKTGTKINPLDCF